MKKYPVETIRHELSHIYLCRGETLTLSLAHCDRADNKPPWEQVEVRVTHDGTMEIYFDGDVRVRRFEDWYKIHRPEAPDEKEMEK